MLAIYDVWRSHVACIDKGICMIFNAIFTQKVLDFINQYITFSLSTPDIKTVI